MAFHPGLLGLCYPARKMAKGRGEMFKWDSKYEIGHERIDFEHRIFLGLILEFQERAGRGDGKERLHRMLTEFNKYAEFHFLSEENIMIDCGYPGYAEHAEYHKSLLAKLRIFTVDYLGDRISAQAVGEMLLDWFALHTTQDDKKIAEYLKTLGSPD
jgi:hemerythrin